MFDSWVMLLHFWPVNLDCRAHARKFIRMDTVFSGFGGIRNAGRGTDGREFPSNMDSETDDSFVERSTIASWNAQQSFRIVPFRGRARLQDGAILTLCGGQAGGRGRLTRDLQDAEGDAHVQGYGRPKLIGRMIVGDNHKRAAGPEQANRGYIQAGHDLSGKHGLTFPHVSTVVGSCSLPRTISSV